MTSKRILSALLLACTVIHASVAYCDTQISETIEAAPLPSRSIDFRFSPFSIYRLIAKPSDFPIPAEFNLDFGITQAITIGPRITYRKLIESSYDYYSNVPKTQTETSEQSLGIESSYFLDGNRIGGGWMLMLRGDATRVSVSRSNGTSGSAVVPFASALFGYQWIWSPGININLNMGARYRLGSPNLQLTSSNGSSATNSTYGWDTLDKLAPISSLTFGWAF